MEEHERRRDSRELYSWMGKTTQRLEDIGATLGEVKRKYDEHIKIDSIKSDEIKTQIHKMDIKLTEAVICPYGDDIMQSKEDHVACKVEQSKAKAERYFMRGGIGTIFIALVTIVKKIWG